MRTSYIVYAIPVFLILIFFEFLFAFFKKKKLYTLDDFVNNISTGTVEQLGAGFVRTLLFIPYLYIYDHHALFSISSHSVLMWILVWLLADFFYYWLHRATHRINFLWAGHSVHHQSDHYNLSVALRQGIIQTLCTWFFYMPIALLGFPPAMFVLVSSLNTLYQFWIHTTLINKMGPLEYVINTPSHHRVHHGKNPQYIDKNYAGSLIVWDKLFGTFEKEDAPVDYGVTEPLDNWCPFYANVKVLFDTWYYSQPLKHLKDRLLCFIMPPEWIVEKIGLASYHSLQRPHVLNHSHEGYTPYLLINIFMLIGAALYCFMTFNPYDHFSQCLIIYVCLSLYLLGHVLNGRRYTMWIECLRTLSLIALSWPTMKTQHWITPSLLCISLINFYLLYVGQFSLKRIRSLSY